MKTVWKYGLHMQAHHSFLLPEGAVVLSVGVDPQDCLVLWAFVDTEAPASMRHFVILGTGHPVPDGLEYLGHVVQGPFVWHVWEDCSK